MSPLTQALQTLTAQEHLTCALVQHGILYTAEDRGIKPVLAWLETSPSVLSDASVADKVVGKAAALLFIHGGIKELYAITISQPALDTLLAHQIPVTYHQLVPRIINRLGDGLCPMESRVLDISEPTEAYLALKDYIPFA